MFDELFNNLQPERELQEIAAIWLNEKVNGTRRISAGDHVCVEDGLLITADYATHKIVGCYGNIINTELKVMLVDVITNEPLILKLK